MSEEYDFSWIQNEERLLLTNKLLVREPVPQLKMVYIYINEYDYIETFVKETHELSPSSILSTDDMIYLIEHHKITTSTSKYKLCDVFLYHIKEDDIQSYGSCESSPVSFQSVPLTNPLFIPPCLPLFHPVTTLYFIYKEHPYGHVVAKSILRKAETKGESEGAETKGESEGAKKTTQKSKRVRITIPNNNKNKTKRSIRLL